MNRTTLLNGAAVLLALMVAVPATAYHINAVPSVADPAGGPRLFTAGDWIAGDGTLTSCESLDPSAVATGYEADDRNAGGSSVYGVGGLCTTGENDVTGTLPPGEGTDCARATFRYSYASGSTVAYGDADCGKAITASYTDTDSSGTVTPGDVRTALVSGATMGSSDYMRLDVCTGLTLDPAGPARATVKGSNTFTDVSPNHVYVDAAGANDCTARTDNTGIGGVDNLVGFTLNFGSYSCSVDASKAFYYSRLYSWWSYDGDGAYTHGDARGHFWAPGSADDRVTTDNVDFWHGHIAIFVNAADASAHTSGSTVVSGPYPNLSGAPATSFGYCGAYPEAAAGASSFRGPALVGDA